jgi:hypothetical protein
MMRGGVNPMRRLNLVSRTAADIVEMQGLRGFVSVRLA